MKELYVFKHRRACLITHNDLYTIKKYGLRSGKKKKFLQNRRNSYSFFQTDLALCSQGKKHKACPDFGPPVSHYDHVTLRVFRFLS